MKQTYFDVGFVIPLKEEAAPLVEQLRNKDIVKRGTRTILTGRLGKKNICIIISGCGKVKSASATQFLIDKFPAKYYIHYGTAGALSTSVTISDIIIATEIVEHDVIELLPEKILPPIHRTTESIINKLQKSELLTVRFGRILSGDEDIVTTKRKNTLLNTFQGLSVDWESAGFALTCNLNHVSMLIVRGISDFAYELSTQEYIDNQSKVVNKLVDSIVVIMNDITTL